jgi:hypothetical protein
MIETWCPPLLSFASCRPPMPLDLHHTPFRAGVQANCDVLTKSWLTERKTTLRGRVVPTRELRNDANQEFLTHSRRSSPSVADPPPGVGFVVVVQTSILTLMSVSFLVACELVPVFLFAFGRKWR